MDLPDVNLTWIIFMSATLLLLTYFWFSRRNPKYPPCPLRPWPIVGNLLQLNPDPREQFAGFRKQCGDIYSVYMGPRHMVILNGLDVVNEAFIKHGDDFSDRAVICLDYLNSEYNKGIFTSNGESWKESRSIFNSTLRFLGLGRNLLAEKIQEEVNYFMKLIENLKGEPKDIHNLMAVSASNILCSFVVGQRYEYDDKEFQRLHEIMKFNLSKLQATAILNFFSWLRFLPGDIFCCKVIARNFREFYDIFARVHIKANEDVVGEPGNFIAAYLQEMKRKERAGEKTFMDRDNLLRLILDLFAAGTETTSNTIVWFLIYMVNYPDIQEKIFDEIKQVVGLERTPTMQDRSKLTYMTATIMEVQRLANLLFLSIPRVVSRDIFLGGFNIPRGAEVMVNFNSIHIDPSLWGEDAHQFRPERFIEKDGSLRTPKAWIPYFIGRRACVGQNMASMELFLYVANIVQRFQVSVADLKTIPPIKGFMGATHTPPPYDLTFKQRRS